LVEESKGKAVPWGKKNQESPGYVHSTEEEKGSLTEKKNKAPIQKTLQDEKTPEAEWE